MDINQTFALQPTFQRMRRRTRVDLTWRVDLIVYLRTSPEVAMSKVKSRSRQEEEALDLLPEDALVGPQEQQYVKPACPATGNYHKNIVWRIIIFHQVIVNDADQDLSTLSRTYSTLAKMVWKMIPKELRTAM